MPSRSSTRRRRTSAEVRTLLINAARDLFRARGYEATTTREIADTAGVSDALLHSNFQSKENLFAAAVLPPFSDLVADYANMWSEQSPGLTFEVRVRRFIERLYELAEENRALLLSAAFQHAAGNTGPEDQLLDALAQTFHSMQDSTILQTTAAGYRLDMPSSIAATTGMVLGVALLEPMIFPGDARRPARERIVEEMTQMIVDHARTRAND